MDKSLVVSYLDAFTAANRQPAPGVGYKDGWYIIDGEKVSRQQLIQMREVLLARARKIAAADAQDEDLS
jgi:hypothetical protein